MKPTELVHWLRELAAEEESPPVISTVGYMCKNAADALEAQAARIATLEAALCGLDEAYCRAGPNLTKAERHEDRMRLIAARAALAKQA